LSLPEAKISAAEALGHKGIVRRKPPKNVRTFCGALFGSLLLAGIGFGANGRVPTVRNTRAAASGHCPVTIPGGRPQLGPLPRVLASGRSCYGNGKLWVCLLPLDGRWVISKRIWKTNGLRNKFGWWTPVPVPVTMEGHKWGMPQVKVLEPSVGMDLDQPRFHPSSLVFPTAGCWQITGRTRDTKLTFVIDVAAGK
jgi:hypothetical protein